jgi:hypothetical protein
MAAAKTLVKAELIHSPIDYFSNPVNSYENRPPTHTAS